MLQVLGSNDFLMHFVPNRDAIGLESVPYFWNINGISIEHSGAYIYGWALPFGGQTDATHLLINGVAHGTIQFSENTTVGGLYPWWPNAKLSEFLAHVPSDEFDFTKVDDVLLHAAHKSVKGSTADKTSLFFRHADMQSEFPDEVIQARIGATNSFQFSMTGLTLSRQFARAYEQYTGLKWNKAELIADWGCGSGRIARHVVRNLEAGQRFVGFDIDQPAIQWNTTHIGDFFEHSDIDPPLPCDANSIDVFYAYSVFTHLTVPNLRKWIKEIARVVSRDGHFMFTVLSGTAFASQLPYADKSILERFASDGFYDDIQNSQLETIDVSGDYYRNIWLSKAFIKAELDEYFEIVAIEENFHYYQDVVICRRRK